VKRTERDCRGSPHVARRSPWESFRDARPIRSLMRKAWPIERESPMDQSQFDFSPCVDSAESQRTTRGGISGRVGLDSGLLYVPREVWIGSDVPLTDSNREMFFVEKSQVFSKGTMDHACRHVGDVRFFCSALASFLHPR
jgi:hypothetical protein